MDDDSKDETSSDDEWQDASNVDDDDEDDDDDDEMPGLVPLDHRSRLRAQDLAAEGWNMNFDHEMPNPPDLD
jgi:hypothetical protein